VRKTCVSLGFWNVTKKKVIGILEFPNKRVVWDMKGVARLKELTQFCHQRLLCKFYYSVSLSLLILVHIAFWVSFVFLFFGADPVFNPNYTLIEGLSIYLKIEWTVFLEN